MIKKVCFDNAIILDLCDWFKESEEDIELRIERKVQMYAQPKLNETAPGIETGRCKGYS